MNAVPNWWTAEGIHPGAKSVNRWRELSRLCRAYATLPGVRFPVIEDI